MENKMKVVGIISSPNFNGNTAALVREALKGAAEQGAEVSEIFLAEHKLGFCTGCLLCTAQGRCPLPDDFEELRKIVYAADGIIIGSPTYASTYNAILKNFCERMGMYTLFTSSFGGKYAAGISTANGSAAKKTAKQIVQMFKIGFFKRAYITGTLGVGILSKGVQTKAADITSAMRLAHQLGAKVANDITRHRPYPMQNLLMRIIVKLNMRPMMTKYILKNKDGREKATYENLKLRGLI
jgi:multimeric flavodoxin WrbA